LGGFVRRKDIEQVSNVRKVAASAGQESRNKIRGSRKGTTPVKEEKGMDRLSLYEFELAGKVNLRTKFRRTGYNCGITGVREPWI